MLTHKDTNMHGTYEAHGKQLDWIQYYVFVRRQYYLFGIPFWYEDRDKEDRPMHELIKRAFGS